MMEQFQIEAFKIVSDLASWSLKYPRSGIYSTKSKMDEELIELEDRAKDLDIRIKAFSQSK